MLYVVRRKQPRHDGTRYFNDRGPCASRANDGASFATAEDAETARKALREPHLWETMTLQDATALDNAAAAALATRMREPMPRRTMALFAMASALGHGIKV